MALRALSPVSCRIGPVLMLLLTFIFLARPGDSSTALRFQRVEEVIIWSDHNLSNPFTDVELKLSITAPADRAPASRFVFYGFHDGDGSGGQRGDVWKFRILLDEPGEWEVIAQFVEPGSGDLVAEAPSIKPFRYKVSSAPVEGEHGHVTVDSRNKNRFRHVDGTPWVPFSVHASMLLDRDIEIARQWIDEHGALGVNALAVRFHSEAEVLGQEPFYHFLKLDGSRALHWPGVEAFDYSRFDLLSWHANENKIEYAQSRGIKLSIWFGISGINRQYQSYGPKDYPDNATLGPKQRLFIRFFLARWAAYTSWWHWTIDSEYEETDIVGGGALTRVRSYAAEMKKLNPWQTLLTTHVLKNWTPQNAPEFDLVTIQRRVEDSAPGAIDCRSHITDNYRYGLPVYNSEGVWNLADSTRTRIASLTHLMEGGFSHIAQDRNDHRMSSWGVTWANVDSRHKQDAAEMGKLASFFNSQGIDINPGKPQHSLVSDELEAPTLLSRFAAMFMVPQVFCLAAAPEVFFIWMPEGGTPTINLESVSGLFSVTRYAGSDLTKPVQLASVSGGKTVTLGPTPTTGFGEDYFYILKNTCAR